MALTTEQSVSLYGTPAYTGWGEVEAAADHQANPTKFANTVSTPAINNGYQPVTAPDVTKIYSEIFEKSKPYYIQLLKESDGDMNRAKAILVEDYKKGVREAKEKNAIETEATQQQLKADLKTMGIDFQTDQETIIDSLNKRGMAVGQMGPNGEFNVLQKSEITPTTDTTSTIATPVNQNLGRGATELGRLQDSQKLRQEAIQRTASRNIDLLGLGLKSITNPQGIDVTKASAEDLAKVDRSQLGTAEQELLRGTDEATRKRQITGENLYDTQQRESLNNATQLAGVGIKEVPQALQSRYNTESIKSFVNTGL